MEDTGARANMARMRPPGNIRNSIGIYWTGIEVKNCREQFTVNLNLNTNITVRKVYFFPL